MQLTHTKALKSPLHNINIKYKEKNNKQSVINNKENGYYEI